MAPFVKTGVQKKSGNGEGALVEEKIYAESLLMVCRCEHLQ